MSALKSYVALGDSFTEGVGDADEGSRNGVKGWADRVAEVLAAGDADFRYANLAVRGKLLDQVVAEQVPKVSELAPELVTIYAGGNDMLRPALDIDDLVGRYEAALVELAATGARILVFTAYDAGWSPVFRRIRGRTAIYNELLREVADRHGFTVVDYWRFDGYDDPRMWDWDRLHMSPLGHIKMAAAVLDVLEVEHDLEMPALPPLPVRDRGAVMRDNLQWARGFAAPWVGRRLRGTSSGDGVAPKSTELEPVSP